jgi:hypothetical protein
MEFAQNIWSQVLWMREQFSFVFSHRLHIGIEQLVHDSAEIVVCFIRFILLLKLFLRTLPGPFRVMHM